MKYQRLRSARTCTAAAVLLALIALACDRSGIMQPPEPPPTPPVTNLPDGAINVVFVIHFDPLVAPGGLVSRASYERERDNLAWLAGFLDDIKRVKGAAFVPKLTLEIAGDHAEYYANDAAGSSLLKALHAAGHELAVHFHTNYKAGPNQWIDAASQNTIEMRRRVTTDHIDAVDALIGKLIGSGDASRIRRERRTLQGHFTEESVALERGFDVITTGRTEVFNSYFEHDPWNPWRVASVMAGANQLGESLQGRWTMVPGAPVLGAIGRHIAWVDVSTPAMRRKFLHLYLEWHARQLGGVLEQRVWSFGWHEHTQNLTGEDGVYGNIANLRDEVREMVGWLNDNFIDQRTPQGKRIARWTTAREVAAEFADWQNANPGVSSFDYTANTTDWNRYPYRLQGLARELMYTHHETELTELRARGVIAHRLLKTDGPAWTYENGRIVSTSATWPVFLLWAEESEKTVDLSTVAGTTLTCIDGITGAASTPDARAVRISTTPLVCAQPR